MAEDGIQALRSVQEGKPALSLVISDFNMPLMNGVETITELRKVIPGLKAILCSGKPEADCLQGQSLDNYVYLGKPFCLRELGAALEHVLEVA